MVTAKSKAFALSAVLSWMAVLSALSVFPLLGDFGDHHLRIDNPDFLFRFLFRFRAFLPIIVPGMIYLTWAFAAANYCFSMAGRSWSSKIPMIAFAVFIVGGPMLIYLGQSPDFRQGFFRATPGILVFLVAAKLLLAGWAFRVSLQRRLLARSAMIKYLVVWTVIAVAFIVPTIIVSQHEQASARTIFSLPLAIILLMPMARIGFAPIAISFGRHR